MKRKRFSKEEAESCLGRRVRLIVGFSDIPKGTSGKVVEIIEIEPNGFESLVEWEMIGRGRIMRDWFTKEEFERSLIEE